MAKKLVCYYCKGVFDGGLIACPTCGGSISEATPYTERTSSQASEYDVPFQGPWGSGPSLADKFKNTLPYLGALTVIAGVSLVANFSSDPLFHAVASWNFSPSDDIPRDLDLMARLFAYVKILAVGTLSYKMMETWVGY